VGAAVVGSHCTAEAIHLDLGACAPGLCRRHNVLDGMNTCLWFRGLQCVVGSSVGTRGRCSRRRDEQRLGLAICDWGCACVAAVFAWERGWPCVAWIRYEAGESVCNTVLTRLHVLHADTSRMRCGLWNVRIWTRVSPHWFCDVWQVCMHVFGAVCTCLHIIHIDAIKSRCPCQRAGLGAVWGCATDVSVADVVHVIIACKC
jgi:hypothetical protein